MEENFADEPDDTRRVLFSTHDTVEYTEQIYRVVRKARAEGVGYMPLGRELFDQDNKYALVHLAGFYLDLTKMSPLYLKQTRMTKIQMYLAFHYHNTVTVSQEFFVYLICFGGLAPGGNGMGDLEDERCIFAPLYNLAFALYKCSSTLPPPIALGILPPGTAWRVDIGGGRSCSGR
jgi:hypothetical protein